MTHLSTQRFPFQLSNSCQVAESFPCAQWTLLGAPPRPQQEISTTETAAEFRGSQSASSSRCFCSISCDKETSRYRKDLDRNNWNLAWWLAQFQRSSSLVMSFAFSPWHTNITSFQFSGKPFLFTPFFRFGSIHNQPKHLTKQWTQVQVTKSKKYIMTKILNKNHRNHSKPTGW